MLKHLKPFSMLLEEKNSLLGMKKESLKLKLVPLRFVYVPQNRIKFCYFLRTNGPYIAC